jgi:hypothetical protein
MYGAAHAAVWAVGDVAAASLNLVVVILCGYLVIVSSSFGQYVQKFGHYW